MTTLELLTLLGWVAALGLSPFAALALPGIAGWLGLLTLPPALSGLATPTVWGALLILVIADGGLSYFRLADLIWTALNGIVKPLAAVLLGAAAASGAPPATLWALALTGGLLALIVHIGVAAARTAARTAGPTPAQSGFTSVRLVAAALLGLLALAAPAFAGAAGALVVAAPLPWLPRLWGAARLPHRAVLASLIAPNRPRDWETGLDPLPRHLRLALAAEPSPTGGPVRSVPATLARLGGRWPYVSGRIVLLPRGSAVFAGRRGLRSAVVELPSGAGRSDHALLIETIEIMAEAPFALCLGPGSPPGPAILAGLAAQARD